MPAGRLMAQLRRRGVSAGEHSVDLPPFASRKRSRARLSGSGEVIVSADTSDKAFAAVTGVPSITLGFIAHCVRNQRSEQCSRHTKEQIVVRGPLCHAHEEASMKCFFDGSLTTSADGHSWLTLAGYMAGDAFWAEFDRSWRPEVLEKREPHAPYLHMCDLISGVERYEGWERDRRNRLVNDANIYLQSLPKKAFTAIVCSIDVTARDALVAQGCQIDAPPYILGHWCVGQAFKWYYDTWPDRLETAYVYFDRGEKFMHPFRQRWLQENKIQKIIKTDTFWGGIAEVEALDATQTPALQAADLLAWAESRERSSIEDRAQRYLAKIQGMIIPSWRLVLDEETLRKTHCHDVVA
jgi:hypothetical protein